MPRRRDLVLLASTLVVCCWRSVALAQDLPGTPDIQPEPGVVVPLEGEEREGEGAAPQRPLPKRPPPAFSIGSSIRVGAGYSDNIFITPDALEARPVGDGAAFASPRASLVYRLSRAFGLVSSYRLYAQQYLEHGTSFVHSGEGFLGYRPAATEHVEIGARGGIARVSDFPQSDTDERHLFLQGASTVAPGSGVAASVSVGLRNFPKRTRTDVRALTIGGLDVILPTDPPTTHVGQEDVVVSASGVFSQAFTRTTRFSFTYGFTSNNSDFSTVDYKTHRLSLAGVSLWRRWLYFDFIYSASFRGFGNPIEANPPIKRSDTLHAVSLSVNFTPQLLRRLPLTQSGVMRLGYDFLESRSNVDAGDFRRNFVSLSLGLALKPLTSLQISDALLPGS